MNENIAEETYHFDSKEADVMSKDHILTSNDSKLKLDLANMSRWGVNS
jgi:hypothetical protein